jgi:hypothetical protein
MERDIACPQQRIFDCEKKKNRQEFTENQAGFLFCTAGSCFRKPQSIDNNT